MSFNLVAINLKDEQGNLQQCHVAKCGNRARYQIFNPLADGDLPDWEGQPICSKHLVEEARHRPEIIMSLLDMMIDAMEAKHVFAVPTAPTGPARIVPLR